MFDESFKEGKKCTKGLVYCSGSDSASYGTGIDLLASKGAKTIKMAKQPLHKKKKGSQHPNNSRKQ
jgi:hypothetical protein